MPAPTPIQLIPIAIPSPIGSASTPLRRSPVNNKDASEERRGLLDTPPSSSASSLGTPRRSNHHQHQHSWLYPHVKHVTIFILFIGLAATTYDNQRLRNHQYTSCSPTILSSPGSTTTTTTTTTIGENMNNHTTTTIGMNMNNHTTTTIGMNMNNHTSNRKSPTYSILPKKIYSVIGLESSGTQFVSQIIQDATKSGPYREGATPYNCKKTAMKGHECNELHKEVQVQHFSLPWGGSCHVKPNPPIVDVVLPPQCSLKQTDPIVVSECNAMAQSLWGVQLDGHAIKYPVRYNLDIVKNKQWYDDHGVEQVFVIVIRDVKISYVARSWHCRDEKLRRQEEEVGSRLIEDAIHTYILNDSDEDDDTMKKELLPYYWNAKQYNNNTDANNRNKNKTGRGDTRRLGGLSSNNNSVRRRLDGALPSKNNVVIVSYESLIKLGATYVKMLYDTLGIESDYIPPVIKNGNEKYLKQTGNNNRPVQMKSRGVHF